jgi:hypothetical protein
VGQREKPRRGKDRGGKGSVRKEGKDREGHDVQSCHIRRKLISASAAEVIRYSALIFDKNSPFALVLLSLSISNSIASTGDKGFSTLRSTQIRDKSSFGISNSSLRVPER